jgi:hypothetical protein
VSRPYVHASREALNRAFERLDLLNGKCRIDARQARRWLVVPASSSTRMRDECSIHVFVSWSFRDTYDGSSRACITISSVGSGSLRFMRLQKIHLRCDTQELTRPRRNSSPPYFRFDGLPARFVACMVFSCFQGRRRFLSRLRSNSESAPDYVSASGAEAFQTTATTTAGRSVLSRSMWTPEPAQTSLLPVTARHPVRIPIRC